MYQEVTFSMAAKRIGGAHALDMDLLCFAQLTAVFTLRHWASLLLDLEERSIGVFAGRRTVAFDAGLTRGRGQALWGSAYVPGTHHAYFLFATRTYAMQIRK